MSCSNFNSECIKLIKYAMKLQNRKIFAFFYSSVLYIHEPTQRASTIISDAELYNKAFANNQNKYKTPEQY